MGKQGQNPVRDFLRTATHDMLATGGLIPADEIVPVKEIVSND